MAKNNLPTWNPVGIIIILPVLTYLLYAVTYSSPVFFADDFHLLKPLVLFRESKTWLEKWEWLYQQHNEHRIIFPRLLTLFDYYLEGHINWVTLTFIANLLWVGTLYFFWQGFRALSLPLWMFIPVPLLLFQPQAYDNVNWSISILQQSDILFWYSLFVFLFAKERYRWAALVAIVATFTHGNGIFTFAIGVFFLATRREWKTLAWWVALMALIAAIYFIGFEKGQQASFGKSLSDPVRLISSFFAFFGSLTPVFSASKNWPVLAGFVVIGLIVAAVFPAVIRSFSGKAHEISTFDRQLLGTFFYLGITGALVAISRSWGGIEAILAPRYQHYAPFAASWAYLAVLKLVPFRRIVAQVAIPAAALFSALCYLTYTPEVKARQDGLLADEVNYRYHQTFVQYPPAFNTNIKWLYPTALSTGICRQEMRMPPVPRSASTDSGIVLTFREDVFSLEGADKVSRSSLLRIENNTIESPEIFLYLGKPDNQPGYWIPTHRKRSGFGRLFSSGALLSPGFDVPLMVQNIEPGQYRIGMQTEKGFAWTKYEVEVGQDNVTWKDL
ncbi:MAG: hypothetical protein J7576_15655 [Siphonobacter aquaeclarae]|nr:hypothetical protein [Siphonobacter aquaeclarae]